MLETNHSKCVVSCIILPHARGKMIQKDFYHLRFIYLRRSTEITINTIRQFTMLYIATGNMIEHEQLTFLNFLIHICYPSCFMFCHGAKWYIWSHIFNKRKMKWYLSDIPVSFNVLVIGIDSFYKKISWKTLKQSQIRLFQTVSFCPDHAVSFCPSDLSFTVFVTIQKYDTPQ